jgi:hypothetical protein
METRHFLLLNFKRTPSQEEHKANFSSLRNLIDFFSGQMTLRRYYQQFAILARNYMDFLQSLPSPESQFSKHGGVRSSYVSKATADFRIPELMKIR